MIKRKIYLILILVIVCQWNGFAQKTYHQSMPEVNKFAFNPAYAGMEASLDVIGWTRSQWQSLSGAPRTYGVQAHMPFYAIKGGVGIKLETDESGPFFKFNADAGYNYVHETNWGYINGGVALGYRQYTFDGALLRTRDGVYDEFNFQHNDPLIFESTASGGQFYGNVGIFVIADNWEVGVSVNDLISSKPTFSIGENEFDWGNGSQIHFYGEYDFVINPRIDISPIIYSIIDKDHLQTLTKVKISYDTKYYFNFGIRGHSSQSLESIVAGFGIQFSENWRVFYSYDIGLNSVAQKGSGSHEFVLGYNLNKIIGQGIKPPVIEHPRYF